MSKYKTYPACTLTVEEAKSLAKFIEKHKVQMVCAQDVRLEISGASGIGTNVYIKCLCGQEEDITDYASW